MGSRPIRIWQTPLRQAQHLNRHTFLGFDTVRRWRWRCYICDLGCTYPAADLPVIYGAALEHLEDEHLASATP